MSYFGQSPVFGDFPSQVITSGGGKTFTLNFTVSSENGLLVFVGGAVQRPGIDFTANGNVLVFSEDIIAGVQIFVYGMGLPKSTLAPSAGSVGDVELSSAFKLNRISQMYSRLKLSASGTNSLVTVSAEHIVLLDDSFNQKVVQNVNLTTLSISASGANGLDTGVSAANTWYSVWVIWNGSQVAGLLSLSENSPTMPSGYTHKKRVGWIRTDNSANKFPLSFNQLGCRVKYKIATGSNVVAYPTLSSGTQGTAPSSWVSIGLSSFVPVSATAIDVQLTCSAQNGNNIWVAPNNAHVTTLGADACAPIACVQPTASAGGAHGNGTIVLESPNIFIIAIQAAGNSRALCLGWEDSL